jgi:hypothetical protein
MQDTQTTLSVRDSDLPVRKAFVPPTLERHEPLPQLTFDLSIDFGGDGFD